MAEDGAVALRMWQADPGRYALVLSDCHMPNLDGFGLTAAIRVQEPAGTHMPIIAVTANAMLGEAQRCLERGMDDYLSKPLRLEELQDKLAQWLPLMDSADVADATTDSVATLQTQPHTTPPAIAAHAPLAAAPRLAIWSPATLTALVGDNPGMHKRLLGKFLVNSEQQVAQINAAATTHDSGTVADVAHALKSAARSVGALELGELCQRLETAGRAGDGAQCATLAAELAGEFAAAAAAINDHLGL